MTQQIIIAACLVLVIEGILPFIAPDYWKRMVLNIASMPPRQVRMVGFLSMLSGVCLLYILN